mmetsp:Transcript_8198/g.20632  ORF Transcript_8198/g.20632 Transcript_8198/m.20632 type:complete len:205 (+) Transcript_8198:1637-2251(+)
MCRGFNFGSNASIIAAIVLDTTPAHFRKAGESDSSYRAEMRPCSALSTSAMSTSPWIVAPLRSSLVTVAPLNGSKIMSLSSTLCSAARMSASAPSVPTPFPAGFELLPRHSSCILLSSRTLVTAPAGEILPPDLVPKQSMRTSIPNALPSFPHIRLNILSNSSVSPCTNNSGLALLAWRLFRRCMHSKSRVPWWWFERLRIVNA